jgi:hypothetical protein
MELTPLERIKLNAARKPIGLLNPGFPMSRRGFRGAPASDLPVTNFEELYPKDILNITKDTGSDLRSQLSFDFTEEPIDIENTKTVYERAQRFLDRYLPGQKPEEQRVINPKTNEYYGKELILHDAMHDFANVDNSLRGEELITIAEKIGATPLAERQVGLSTLTQQLPWFGDRSYQDLVDKTRALTRLGGPMLTQLRGVKQGSSLFRDLNDPRSFLSPPISKEEFYEMAQRGREFYDQVHSNWKDFKTAKLIKEIEKYNDPYGLIRTDADNPRSFIIPSDSDILNIDATPQDLYSQRRKIYLERDDRLKERRNIRDKFMGINSGNDAPILTQKIIGGYNKGGLSYGNPLALMNAPLVPTVNRDLYFQQLNNTIKKGISALESKTLEDIIDPSKVDPSKADPFLSSWALSHNMSLRRRRDILDENRTSYINWRSAFDEKRGVTRSGMTNRGPTAAAPDLERGPNARIYLNPPNLGSQAAKPTPFDPFFEAAGIDPKDAILDAAAKAKEIEKYNKVILPQMKRLMGLGFKTTAELTGSIPLFDPEFRAATDRGDGRTVARLIGTDYATGAVAAPIISTGMGVLQRLTPNVAGIVAGGLNIARTANPIAVVSQMGGSSKITPRVAAAEALQRKEKIKLAQAARARGGKWKFPTPFGNFRIPELGISETGGLFFP